MSALEDAARSIEAELPTPHSNRVVALQCNVREEDDVKRLFKATREMFGRPLTCLVNNAGGQFPSPAASISSKGWRSVIDLNLNGTFMMCREAYETSFKDSGGGAIVNIVAEVRSGFPGMAHTGAARAGVINLAQTLAVEWAHAGVRVNCVAPGIIFHESADAHYEKITGTKGFLVQHLKNIPARRLGTVEEVAAAVVFLLSPAAQYISGVNLEVNGAQHLTPSTGATTFVEHGGWPMFRGGAL